MKKPIIQLLSAIKGSSIFVVILILTISYTSKAQSWLWAQNSGGSGENYGWSTTTDKSGNVFVTGTFSTNSITFGSITLLNADSGEYAMYIVKYDPNGNVLWAQSAGDYGNDEGLSVATDASGNVYVTGYFTSSTITFGSYTLTNAGGFGEQSAFLVKFDSNGNVQWATAPSQSDYIWPNSVATDPSGNVYVAGTFIGTTTIGSITFDTQGNTDFFLAKYNSIGVVQWLYSGGGEYYDYGNSVATDANGNVYFTGEFGSGSVSFGSIVLNNAWLTQNIFIAKFNSSGTVLWAESAGGNQDQYSYSVAVDGNDNSYITGYYLSPLIYFGNYSLTNNTGYADAYLVKYDPNGNAQWATSTAGPGIMVGNSISTDANNNINWTGFFDSTSITFGSTMTYTNNGQRNIFIAKYDANGNAVNAESVGGSDEDAGISIATDPSGNIVLTGYITSNSVSFGSVTLTSGGMFVAKSSEPTGISSLRANEYISVFPNPTSNQVTLEAKLKSPDHVKVFLTNILGQSLQTVDLGIVTNEIKQSIDLSNYPKGVYIIEFVKDDEEQILKVVKQ